MCKFGASNCVYSHTKSFLPPGWWENSDEVAQARELLALAQMHSRHLPAFNDFIHSLSGDTVGSRHSPFIEKVGFGASGENKADVSSGPMPVLEESCSKPFIILLALDGNNSVERYSESLIAAIRVKLDLVKAVASDVALQHLASSHLASVDGCRNNPP